jgi:hypothetical protein
MVQVKSVVLAWRFLLALLIDVLRSTSPCMAVLPPMQLGR